MGLQSSKSSYSDNSTINSKIFKPPTIPIEHFASLNSYRSTIHNIETDQGNISFLLVVPKKVNLYDWHTFKNILIFSHGCGSNIYTKYKYMKYLSTQLNIITICYDYTGYGLSKGNPKEEHCYNSLDVIVNHVKIEMKFAEKNILLMGHSLGTGIVVDFAFKNNWTSPIILLSPYKSIMKVKFDNPIVSPIDKFETYKKIKNISCPVKIFHGINDNTINILHGKSLYDKLQNKILEPIWMENTGHDDILWKLNIDDILYVINYSNTCHKSETTDE